MNYRAYRREARRDTRKPVVLSDGPGWHSGTPGIVLGQMIQYNAREGSKP